MSSSDALVPQAVATSSVPVGYAEKAMASIMQLHSDLMDEKDRRVDLYRKLMEREQTIAELRLYVRMLEEKLARQNETESVGVAVATKIEEPTPTVRPASIEPPTRRAPVPPQMGAKAKVDSWRSW